MKMICMMDNILTIFNQIISLGHSLIVIVHLSLFQRRMMLLKHLQQGRNLANPISKNELIPLIHQITKNKNLAFDKFQLLIVTFGCKSGAKEGND